MDSVDILKKKKNLILQILVIVIYYVSKIVYRGGDKLVENRVHQDGDTEP